MSDTFAVVAEPTRRRILDQLLRSEASVNELVDALGISQTAMSKHLRVLRDSQLVTTRIDAQRRIYALNSQPLSEIEDWLSNYRKTWNQHVDELAKHLDRQHLAKEEELS